MHEMGIIAGVLDAVGQSARQAQADRVLGVTLSVGEMTQAIPEALQFAFEALAEGTLCEGAALTVNMIAPSSLCLECGHRFEHDRFHKACPKCSSALTQLEHGRELEIDSIEVELDEGGDDEDRPA